MPGRKEAKKVKPNPQNDDMMDDCPSNEEETPIVPGVGKKRSVEEAFDGDTGGDFREEMQNMLEGFKSDISKTLSSKRKKLEQMTQHSLKSSNKRVDEVWKHQQIQRKR